MKETSSFGAGPPRMPAASAAIASPSSGPSAIESVFEPCGHGFDLLSRLGSPDEEDEHRQIRGQSQQLCGQLERGGIRPVQSSSARIDRRGRRAPRANS